MQFTPKFDQPVNNQSKEKGDGTSVSSRASMTAPSASRETPRSKKLLIVFAFLVSLVTGFFGGWLGADSRDNANSPGSNPSIARQKQIAQSDSQLIASIAKTVGPSVVSVNVVAAPQMGTDIFGFPIESRPQQGAGTGIIISSDGLIMTNRHVVPQGVTDVSVTLSDGTELDDVKIIDRTNEGDGLDVAFLKVQNLKGKKLTPAEIGDSSKVAVGDLVVAIGNALGQFNNTVTSGIISGYGRSVIASGDGTAATAESLNDLFQTDAAINQGNSGGPLVNIDGQVIGINTAVAGRGENIGFAIPINDVNGLIKQVLETGTFERPYIGIRYVRLTPDAAKEFDLNVERGAYIPVSPDSGQSSIIEGSPADRAGLREGDIITAVNGKKIDERHSLNTLIGQHMVGDTVEVRILRDGRTITRNIELAALPSSIER